MTAHEIFQNIPAEKSVEVVTYLHAEDRNSYKAVLNLLATRRKLRPVFLEKKPKTEQLAWVAEALGKKANEDLAHEILQTWVLKANSEIVLRFLKDLGIDHDGAGVIEETPSEPAPETVQSAVDNLLESFDACSVAVYLHLFVEMDPEGWPTLRQLLITHPKLSLSLEENQAA